MKCEIPKECRAVRYGSMARIAPPNFDENRCLEKYIAVVNCITRKVMKEREKAR